MSMWIVDQADQPKRYVHVFGLPRAATISVKQEADALLLTLHESPAMDFRAHLVAVLAIVDSKGYMTAEQQDVLRAAREAAAVRHS